MAQKGRKPHKATEETRRTVEAMCSYGIPQPDIAAVIGIDPKTLRLYYREELDTATAKANARVAGVLYKKCLDDEDTASVIFWLKTRAKWSETIKTQNQTLDKDGNPIDDPISAVLATLSGKTASLENE